MVDIRVYEDMFKPIPKTIGSAGFPRDELSMTPVSYEGIRAGCFQREARLAGCGKAPL
jgi:hypothetical protein